MLVVLIAMATAVGLVLANSSPKTPTAGRGPAALGGSAPGFSTWDLSGRPVSLSDFNGRPVLVSFWATSCTACQAEFPALQRILDANRSSGFTVLAVDYRETNTAFMSAYLAGLHVSFRAVIDPQGTIAAAYEVNIGLPVNVWLDRSHTVRRIMIGAQSEPDLAAAAAQVTASPPA